MASRDPVVVASFKIPRGRSAAERHLQAVAALHQPIPMVEKGVLRGDTDTTYYVCGECKRPDSVGRLRAALWPCTTVRMIGTWPGEDPTDDGS